MPRLLKFLVVGLLVAVPWAAGAQDIHINPVPPGHKLHWRQVPGVPKVFWDPKLPTDVFRYRGKYYFFWANFFYQGRTPKGPWKRVKEVPEVFYDIDPAYFKTVRKEAAPPPPAEPAPPPPAEVTDIPPATPPAGPAEPPASGRPAAPAAPTAPPKAM